MMKHGARNKLAAKVTSVKKGDVMALVKFQVTDPRRDGLGAAGGPKALRNQLKKWGKQAQK